MTSNVRSDAVRTSPIYSRSSNCLLEDGELPAAYQPHQAVGRVERVYGSVHIEPDWLLIYEVTANEVLLHQNTARIATCSAET